MKTIFNIFAISLISFTVFAQKSHCKYWLTTFNDIKATMVLTNESQSYLVVHYKNNYKIKKMKILADSSIVYDDVIGIKLTSLSADTLAIRARTEPYIKFHCLNDEVAKQRLNHLISFGCKDIESFSSDSLFLLKDENKEPFFVDFKGIKIASFEKVLPMDSTGFWVKQQDEWRLLDTHFKESTTISGSFSEVIKNASSDFAIADDNNNWGYMHGSLFIKPQYDSVLFYGHGLLPVLVKNKGWILLDDKGKNCYPKLSFKSKPMFKMNFWLGESLTDVVEIKEHLYRVWKKSELKLKLKSKKK